MWRLAASASSYKPFIYSGAIESGVQPDTLVNDAPLENVGDWSPENDHGNTFLVSSLLQDVTRVGTAARAQATLKRPDLYGKTGTTNDMVDAWFAGYQPSLVAVVWCGVVWVGYDAPRSLGSRASGSATALKEVPVQELPAPEGVARVDGAWRSTFTIKLIAVYALFTGAIGLFLH